MQNIIQDISCYFPANVLTNERLQVEFPELKVPELTRLTGVTQRHICSEDQTSVDMAVAAAHNLFHKSSIKKSDIDFVIYCSAGGDYITPASSCIIHNRLALPAHCGAFDYNQGCTGFIYGLSMADSMISAGNADNILLITSEAITKTIHPNDSSNRAIFGDAATASLIVRNSNVSKFGKFIFGTDGSKYDRIIIKHGRERFPLPKYAEEDRLDSYGNTRNDANFFMDGSEVFNFSVAKAPELVSRLLTKSGLNFDDIDFFVFHQANQIILETIGKKIKIPDDKMIIDIKTTGNTVSSTIPIVLKNAIDQGKIKRGNILLIAGFGVGFSWGGTIMKI
ncbi:MAG: ketoacyl-ACP synthase III [Bacteroidetes bacterium]|nr:ketoacyl-ACP synthase III [Bacteroidota bacterium]